MYHDPGWLDRAFPILPAVNEVDDLSAVHSAEGATLFRPARAVVKDWQTFGRAVGDEQPHRHVMTSEVGSLCWPTNIPPRFVQLRPDPAQCFLLRCAIARDSPSSVSGNMRPPIRLLDQRDRLAVIPELFGLRIEPDGVRPGVEQAAQPDGAGFLVPVLDAAAGLEDFVGAHRRVADEDQLVVGAVFVHHVLQSRCARSGGDGCPSTRRHRRSCGSRNVRGA